MRERFSILLLSFILFHLTTLVSAHGYLAGVTINGQSYSGNVPGAKPTSSVIRQVSDIGPVQPAENPFLNCGLDAQFADDVANANPGDTFEFKWVGGGGNNWPHNTGPMLTYLTSCGSSSCAQYNSSSSKWFKIAQIGRTSTGGPWAQAALTTGGVATVTLPSNLAPGNYIIRHELIALQNAVSEGGAEFYPACVQLTVGGSQSGKPDDSDLVLLPGAYSDTDPGIYDPNVYDPSASYTFPGPPIASFISGNSGGSSNSSSGSSSGSTSTSSASGSQSTGSTGVCRLQRRIVLPSTNADAVRVRKSRRRHIGMSDVMRDIILGTKKRFF